MYLKKIDNDIFVCEKIDVEQQKNWLLEQKKIKEKDLSLINDALSQLENIPKTF